MPEIICGDSLGYLVHKKDVGAIVTSLPDAVEMGMDFEEWVQWFHLASMRCMCAANSDAPSIFFQTDRKVHGTLASKAEILLRAARDVNVKLLWHKIVLRREPGKLDIFRPTYSHLMAFSRTGTSGTPTPDVMERGRMVYPNAFGLTPAKLSIDFARKTTNRLLDPFCGRGTIPALAEAMGMKAVGIDIDPSQVEHARRMKFRASEEIKLT